MAEVVAFPAKSTPKSSRGPAPATAEIVLFPGVRVEYRDSAASVDLSRRPHRPGCDKIR